MDELDLKLKLLLMKEQSIKECLNKGEMHVDYSEGSWSLLDELTGRNDNAIFVGNFSIMKSPEFL